MPVPAIFVKYADEVAFKETTVHAISTYVDVVSLAFGVGVLKGTITAAGWAGKAVSLIDIASDASSLSATALSDYQENDEIRKLLNLVSGTTSLASMGINGFTSINKAIKAVKANPNIVTDINKIAQNINANDNLSLNILATSTDHYTIVKHQLEEARSLFIKANKNTDELTSAINKLTNLRWINDDFIKLLKPESVRLIEELLHNNNVKALQDNVLTISKGGEDIISISKQGSSVENIQILHSGILNEAEGISGFDLALLKADFIENPKLLVKFAEKPELVQAWKIYDDIGEIALRQEFTEINNLNKIINESNVFNTGLTLAEHRVISNKILLKYLTFTGVDLKKIPKQMQFENLIRCQEYEWNAVYKNGYCIGLNTNFHPEYANLPNVDFTGADITHNHPSGSFFSILIAGGKSDLKTITTINCKSLSSVGIYGDVVVYKNSAISQAQIESFYDTQFSVINKEANLYGDQFEIYGQEYEISMVTKKLVELSCSELNIITDFKNVISK